MVTIVSFLEPGKTVAQDRPFVRDLYVQSKGGEYREPTPQELSVVEQLFPQMLKGDRSAGLVDRWAKIGMRVIVADHDGRDYTVLMEDENHKYGRGFFVFPEASKQPIGLFVPHRFTDELTGVIGLSMAFEGSFSVIAWNTVKRRGGGRPAMYWDMGKLRHTYFVALTKAFAQVFPDGYHVQIHGYVTGKRRTAAGNESDAIVSGGVVHPRPAIYRLRDCLQEKGFGKVSVYPTDVRELGATKNVSGIVLREMGNRGFVHIEMNVELRERLKDRPEARRGFTECLLRELR